MVERVLDDRALVQITDFLEHAIMECPDYALVVEHGKLFEAMSPIELIGEPGNCFADSSRGAKVMDLSYVEGFASFPEFPIPTHHAWIEDAEGRVIDPAWATLDIPNASYIGIVYERHEVALSEIENGHFGGVLYWQLRAIKKFNASSVL